MFSLSRQIDSASSANADLLYQQIQGKNADGTNDPNRDALLDADNFIDYMITHLYAGVEDWPSHNWYATRNRVDPGDGFQFFTWDQEISLDQLYRDRTGANNSNTPGELFQNLRNSSEFRLRFADRVQKHLYNDGALTTEANQARWMQRADQIEAGIIGESARWGDAKEGQNVTAYTSRGPFNDGHIPTGNRTIPLMTVDHWRDSVDYVHDSFFVNAGGLMVSRLAADGLVTSVDAPQFSINGNSQHGGPIFSGSNLGITGAGAIYYTLDGSDPRAVGGSVNGTLYTGLVDLDTTTVVKARVLSGGQWSAVTEATFTTDDSSLLISEINYNPYEPTTAAELAISGITNDDFEFIEVVNTHPTTSLSLLGTQLAGGVSYTFGNVQLAAGERAVVVEDAVAFRARYGTSVRILGQWSGGLSSSGEELILNDPLGGEIMSVSYNDKDPWAVSADGAGATLVMIDATATPSEQGGKYYRWRGSAELGGTPGEADSETDGIVINEVLTNSAQPTLDAIELYNPTNSNMNIGGWFLSDSRDELQKFVIPAGTMLNSGQYIVFDENDFNTGPNAFALSSAGDEVYLTKPGGVGSLTFVDQIDFGGSFVNETLGRIPDGVGRLAPLASPSLGDSNSVARIGGLVVSEVNFHPEEPTAGAQLAFQSIAGPNVSLTDDDLEYVEVHNPTHSPININNWRLRGEVDFDFVPALIAAQSTIVIVSFNPTTDTARLAGFSAHYGLSGPINFVGGFAGKLNNSFGRVELQRPAPGSVDVFVTADEVLYDDLAPWPLAINGNGALVDGGGASVERAGPTLYGNDATSWFAAAPSPGAVDYTPALAGDYNRNGVVDQVDYDVWVANFNSTIALNADGNGNGIVDAADFTIWRDNVTGNPKPFSSNQSFTGNTSSSGTGPTAGGLAPFQPSRLPRLTPGLVRPLSLVESTEVIDQAILDLPEPVYQPPRSVAPTINARVNTPAQSQRQRLRSHLELRNQWFAELSRLDDSQP